MDDLLIRKYVKGEALTPAEKSRIVTWVKADGNNRARLSTMYKVQTA
jgi:hypothetical protein